MSWDDKIRDYFRKEGFGTYLVELKNPFYFKLDTSIISTIKVETNGPTARHPLTDRTITGIHRKSRDIESESLHLEIFGDFGVIIPYSSIKDFEKIRDSYYVFSPGVI